MMLTINRDKTQIAPFKGKFLGKPAEKEGEDEQKPEKEKVLNQKILGGEKEQRYNSQCEDDNKHSSPDWGGKEDN